MSPSQPAMSLETVTPAKAQKWLDNQKVNRKPSLDRVGAFVAMVERGEFHAEESTLSFYEDGRLADGQHRLLMVVQTGKTFKFRIQRGVGEEFFAHVDDVKPRGLYDCLYIEGEAHWIALAATIRNCYAYEIARTMYHTNRASLGYPSNAVYLNWLEANPTVRESVRLAELWKTQLIGLVPPSMVAVTHYLFSRKEPELAGEFWEAVSKGVGVQSEHDPRSILRERLIKGVRQESYKMTSRYRSAIILKAWNAWINGDSIRHLKWRPAAGEKYPLIVGWDPLPEPEVDESKREAAIKKQKRAAAIARRQAKAKKAGQKKLKMPERKRKVVPERQAAAAAK